MTQSEVPRADKARVLLLMPDAGHFRLGRLNEAALIWQGNCLLGIQSGM
jgi:hypothetical protein